MIKKKILIRYSAFFEINIDGISISFPDIPECLSCAFNKRQSLNMAKDALKLALHGVRIDELPARKYPVKRFTSHEFYIRTIYIKMEIKNNCLYDKNVIDLPNTDTSYYKKENG